MFAENGSDGGGTSGVAGEGETGLGIVGLMPARIISISGTSWGRFGLRNRRDIMRMRGICGGSRANTGAPAQGYIGTEPPKSIVSRAVESGGRGFGLPNAGAPMAHELPIGPNRVTLTN